jgi:integrase/recombinase XerD
MGDIVMFDKYFELPTAIARHRSAPLAKEREQFLAHLEAGGTGRQSIRAEACYLLQVVRLLRLRRLRSVTLEEVEQAADSWNKLRNQANNYRAGKSGADYFAGTARRFLRFLGRLKNPHVHQPFSKCLHDFVDAMSSERGLSAETIRTRRYRAAEFLKWYGTKHRRFREIRVADVDAYINLYSARGWSLVTKHSEASSLRAFFLHAENRGWCRTGIASAVRSPPIRRELFEPQGPAWGDVQRLLASTRGSQPNEVRARALLFLFAIYGLRRSEAANLLLTDIDWAANRFTVRRAKRGGFQQLPLSDEVGRPIRRYIENVRPHCSFPNVFISLTAPFRPLVARSMSDVVHSRMRKLGISSKHIGPQCLRHACATRLLHTGSSFVDIADFLGHRDTQSVNVYARLHSDMLREVAVIDLVGGL